MARDPMNEAILELHQIFKELKYPLSKENILASLKDRSVKFGDKSLTLRQLLLSAPLDYFPSMPHLFASLQRSIQRLLHPGTRETKFGEVEAHPNG